VFGWPSVGRALAVCCCCFESVTHHLLLLNQPQVYIHRVCLFTSAIVWFGCFFYFFWFRCGLDTFITGHQSGGQVSERQSTSVTAHLSISLLCTTVRQQVKNKKTRREFGCGLPRSAQSHRIFQQKSNTLVEK
jgi:hypothetical protein